MIEPFEPIRVERGHDITHAIELHEIARHVLLRNNERDSASGKSAQRLPPSLLRRRVHDIVEFGRVEIVALDPYAGQRRWLARITSDDLAGRPRHLMSSEELEHSM